MSASRQDETADPATVIAALRAQLAAALADKAALEDALAARSSELAMRNSEYDERIGYQSATSDVLKAMSASPGNPQPVFDLIVRRARDLCDAYGVTVYEFDGELVHFRGATGISDNPEVRNAVAAHYPMPATPEMFPHRAIVGRKLIRIDDLKSEPGLHPIYQAVAVKSAVAVPLMRGDTAIGALGMGSRELGGFTDSQIELLKTFADQAVIAIENARLFNETQQALERQTATAEILKVIAASPSDAQPVFEAIAERSNRLVSGRSAAVHMVIDGKQHLKAFTRTSPEADAVLQAAFPRPLAVLSGAEQIRRGEVFEIADTEIEFAEQPALREMGRQRGYRSLVIVPLLRGRELIGLINVTRVEPGRFAARHVALLQTFADQAVIAIENARLFNETQQALERQTATADILKVIAGSPDDVQPVFEAIVQTGLNLFPSSAVMLALASDGMIKPAAIAENDLKLAELLKNAFPVPLSREFMHGLAILDGQLVDIPDAQDSPDDFHAGRRAFLSTGHRAITIMPMMRGDQSIGALSVVRRLPGSLSDRQLELLKTFADQAVIAIENTRLLKELRLRTQELSQSLDDLRTAQDRLVQTEKLASLGQLTAGIAHEIKNPLNFVNNFSGMSAELIGELQEVVNGLSVDAATQTEIKELTEMLAANLGKIVHHGGRADAIVKSMLLHSGQSSGEHRPSDINALVDECLNRAYYGERAETRGFTIKLERSFDPAVGEVDLFPREISRAVLNLISNGFYATSKRRESEGADYEPVLVAATRNLGDCVEIRIRDNGAGIPADVKEKMFDPFFTTKPAGEGTGLGLSITHDIIVKQHRGRIDVETRLGEFTEFIIALPREDRRAGSEPAQ